MLKEHTLDLTEIIMAARGEKKVDTLFINGNIVNVFSGEIYQANVAVHGGLIVGFGDYVASQTIDLQGKFLCPGFMDGHMHLESSMVSPTEFARAVIPKGTTTIVCDPHEIANVKGIEGIKYILRANKVVPLDIYAMVPSCVPATEFETSGATLSAEELKPSFGKDWILGLGELMDFPGLLEKDPHVLKKVRAAGRMRIDGHAPGVKGKDLYAYIAAGAVSDHECTNYEEAHEKLKLGMYIMIREGSVTRDLDALYSLVKPLNMRRCMFVTDDREPVDLMDEGHLNFLVKKSISKGMDPTVAVSLASVNTAEYFGIKNVGAIAPGYMADLLVIDNFKDFNIEMVFKKGQLVARNGEPLFTPAPLDNSTVAHTVNIKHVDAERLAVKAEGEYINVMEIIPDQIITKRLWEKAKIENGKIVSDTERDILKMAVIERHHGTGNIGIGFVKGFGIKKGALASTIAHDSHNLIVLGTNDEDMLAAVEEIKRIQGGLVAVADGRVLGELSLPIAGLMSDQPLAAVRKKLDEMHEIASGLGATPKSPFMALSFMALPVIPEIKVTDKGIVDVTAFKLIGLFER